MLESKDVPSEQAIATAYRPQNDIRRFLATARFFWTIEFVASSDHLLSDDMVRIDAFVRELARRSEVAGFSVTDRVHSDRDPDPMTIACHIRDHSGTEPLVHWAGKNREPEDLDAALERMRSSVLRICCC